MGKRIISQRRGRGTTTYRSPSHRFKGNLEFIRFVKEPMVGIVKDIYHDPGKSAPIAKIELENKEIMRIPAPLGLKVNDHVTYGAPNIKEGNILSLEQIPEGTFINSIEKVPGSGPSFCRSAGTFAKVVSKFRDRVVVTLPSKKQRNFDPKCMAGIGVIAGGGKKDKPIVKAGKMHHIKRARGRLYPRTSGVAMNAVDHPFGCGRGRHVGKPKTVSRNAPPGRKVGLIGARRTGRKR